MVLVVSAGERQSAVDKAVTRLRASGATVLGTVLNRVGRPAATRATAGAGAPAAAGGWQDTGSGMFAAAVGGPAASPKPVKKSPETSDAPASGPARRVVASTTPKTAPVEKKVVVEGPAPAGTPEESFDADDLNVADVLSAVTFDEPAEAETSESDEPFAAAVPEEEAPDDLDALTERLAEEIASGVEGDDAGPASEPADGAGDADEAADGEPEAPAKPRVRVVRTRPGPDASLDRLVDRHIDASLPDKGAAPGRDAETGRGSRR